MDRRYIIVGAGALGVSLAYFLHRIGVKKILIFDKGVLASGATGKSAGILSHHLWNQLDVKLTKRSAEIFKDISNRSKGFFSIRPLGMLSIARNSLGRQYLQKITEFIEQENIPFTRDQREILKKFPDLNLPSDEASELLFTYDDFYSDPGLYTYAIYSYLKDQGVDFYLLKKVLNIDVKDNGVRGVEVRGVCYYGDVVILSTGVWTNTLLEKIGLGVPLIPYRTQAGILKMQKSVNIPIINDLENGLYARPELSDSILVGNGTEEKEASLSAWRPDADERFIFETLAKFSEVLPDAEDALFTGGWAGLCGATPDQHPLIGEVSNVQGLYVFCGMNGFGYMRAPALAESFAHYIIGKEPPLNIYPYLIDRFRGKKIQSFKIKQGFSRGLYEN